MDNIITIQKSEQAHLQIEHQIRNLISEGTLTLGERLPSTMRMAEQLKVSCTTMQRALKHLTADGLLERRPRMGTFVSTSTEKQAIGILMFLRVADEASCFYRSMLFAFQTLIEERGMICRLYDGLSPVEKRMSDEQRNAHLAKDLRLFKFKGLIGVGMSLSDIRDLVPHTTLPKASMCGSYGDVDFDEYKFGKESVEYLANVGRKKILYLRCQDPSKENFDYEGMQNTVRKFNLPNTIIEKLTRNAGLDIEKQAYEKMDVLVRNWKNKGQRQNKPDALIVSDDIVMRGAALALLKHNISVPDSLLVITHANKGINLHYGIPVVRYEFSPRKMAECTLDILWKRINNEELPKLPMLCAGMFSEVEKT